MKSISIRIIWLLAAALWLAGGLLQAAVGNWALFGIFLCAAFVNLFVSWTYR